MTFWQENYSFIKEVYDTRYAKMVEWMDNVEMAIQKVCASKVYTSNEFKREKDNFQSLCKNLERSETKRWLTETLETLMKERTADEQKAESSKLKIVMERHKVLIPKIKETLVKTECYWKCYSYGDDLIPIFEFIDDLRNRSVKEVLSSNNEHTEEHIEKQEKVLNSLENKKRMVLDFIAKGQKLMEDSNCPKFLESHVSKLKDAWEDTNEKAQARKKGLSDNLGSWEIFEDKRQECHKQLDQADGELDSIKKIFDLRAGPSDHALRVKTAKIYRSTIEGIFNTVKEANDILQQMLPDDKKADMNNYVAELVSRMTVLEKTDEKLAFIEDFNKRLNVWDAAVIDMEKWLEDGRKKIDVLKNPPETMSPEDRVTKAMEMQEDINKKSDFTKKEEIEKEEIFPKPGEKISSDCKKMSDRIKKVRSTLDGLDEEVKNECAKFSEDIKYWAEFQTGLKVFKPWMKKVEDKIAEGLSKPKSLVEACEILGYAKIFQDECETKLKVLDDAAAASLKMTSHKEADHQVEELKIRWIKVHEITMEWVSRMTTLVGCWNMLDGKVEEISSWVQDKNFATPDENKELSIEKLENQLNTLKTMFAEKQQLVSDLEAFGPGRGTPQQLTIAEEVLATHATAEVTANAPLDDAQPASPIEE